MKNMTPEDMLQSMIEGLVSIGMARGVREAATQLMTVRGARRGHVEDLRTIDTTEIDEHARDGFRIVVVKQCPFGAVKGAMGEWSEKSKAFTKAYNERPTYGGGAFDPICIIHRFYRHFTAGDAILQLGCASKSGVIVSDRECDKLGFSTDEARSLLEGNACLYALVS